MAKKKENSANETKETTTVVDFRKRCRVENYDTKKMRQLIKKAGKLIQVSTVQYRVRDQAFDDFDIVAFHPDGVEFVDMNQNQRWS